MHKINVLDLSAEAFAQHWVIEVEGPRGETVIVDKTAFHSFILRHWTLPPEGHKCDNLAQVRAMVNKIA
ncbi:hypothetical protein D3C78_1265900 [compost metagenome]